MLVEIRRACQLAVLHNGDDEETFASVTILFSSETMAAFQIVSPLWGRQPSIYALSWFNGQCWIADPFYKAAAFFRLPLDIHDCIDAMIFLGLDDDCTEELAYAIHFVYTEALNDSETTFRPESDDLPF